MNSEMLASLEQFKVTADSLKSFPGNARVGNVAKIAKSLRNHEQYRPLVVNIREGGEYGDMTVLAGNQTLAAAREVGLEEVYVWYVDRSDEEALEINLIDNATSDDAYNDPELLAALLSKVGDTERAGYDEEFLANLSQEINPDFKPESAEPVGRLDERSKTKCPECGHEFAP